MLRCEWEACGYSVRTSRKWLETIGTLLDPIARHSATQHDPRDDGEKDMES